MSFLFDQPPEQTNIYKILFENHKKYMYFAALQILNDRNQAEDAVQQAFERMIQYRAEEKIANPLSNKTRYFLLTIIQNVSFSLLKKNSDLQAITALEEECDSQLSSFEADPLEFILSEELVQQIQAAIHQLDPRYADVLILKRVYGYSDQEIAGFFNLSPNHVRVRLHRAKKMLREILKKEGIINDTQ